MHFYNFVTQAIFNSQQSSPGVAKKNSVTWYSIYNGPATVTWTAGRHFSAFGLRTYFGSKLILRYHDRSDMYTSLSAMAVTQQVPKCHQSWDTAEADIMCGSLLCHNHARKTRNKFLQQCFINLAHQRSTENTPAPEYFIRVACHLLMILMYVFNHKFSFEIHCHDTVAALWVLIWVTVQKIGFIISVIIYLGLINPIYMNW